MSALVKKRRPSSRSNFFDEISDVSKVKHGVLSKYIGAWMAILTRNPWRTRGQFYSESRPQYSRIVYVDGFAGPGKYLDDTNGSPAVAYELALGLSGIEMESPDICMIFIEKSRSNCETLHETLVDMREECMNMVNVHKVKYMVICGEFVRAMEWILSPKFIFPTKAYKHIYAVPEHEPRHFLSSHQRFIGAMTPLLVFADPFGYNGKDMPMSLMRSILNCSEKSEILVNLMTGHIRRFWKLDSRTRPINLLIGDDEDDASWKPYALEGDDKREQLKKFLEFYHQQLVLESEQELYTCLFEMRDKRNKLMYNLYHVTHHNTGFQKMKEAMRKVSHDEELFKFSAFDAKNPYFEVKEVSIEDLTKRIVKHFRGKVVAGYVITKYIERDPYLTQHFKRKLKTSLADYCVYGSKRSKFDENQYNFCRRGSVNARKYMSAVHRKRKR